MQSRALALALSALANAAPAAAESPADRAVAGALAGEVERSPAWQRLVHYQSDGDGRRESEIDGGSFFLSPRGKTSPSDELEATIRGLFASQDPNALDEHAGCRFPARHALLGEELGLEDQLPVVRCPKLEAFVARLQPQAVGLIYVGASVRHPASAMGHTFVSIGPRARFASAIEGKHAVDYAAKITTNNPVTYVIAGMSGVFEGHFRVVPLSQKIDEYADEAGRDMWQYELRLTPDEARRVALHLWELRQATIDYYYLTENCSYHVLSLIEGAVPRLDLSSRIKELVIPLDTVKALDDDEVRSVSAFPSKRRQELEGIEPGSPAGEDHPAAGHGPFRFRFGGGMTSRSPRPFAKLGFRLALHDIADPPRGHAELIQVQLFDTVLRIEGAAPWVRLDEVTFVEMMTLRPMSARELAPSWRVRALGLRLSDAGCPSRDCFAHGLNGGIGAAIAASGAFTLFGMAEGWTLFGSELDGVDGAGVRLGLGPYVGARLRLDDFVAVLGGRWTVLPGQAPLHTFDAAAELRMALASNAALGLEGKLTAGGAEGVLWSFLYF
jgi:hypothetical protein